MIRFRASVLSLALPLTLIVAGCGGNGGGGGAPAGTIEEFADEGRSTIATNTQAIYNTDPPTSGPHYDLPTAPGFYTTAQERGFLVHSLEHSSVVIYYDPARTPQADQDSLKALADQHKDTFAGIVVVPRSDSQFMVIAAAWRHRLRLTAYNAAQIQTFLDMFLGKGPVTTAHVENEPIESFADEGHVHVPQGTAITYQTDPPNSGPHYPIPAANGFYDVAPAAGNLVHALEHSNIEIYYDAAHISAADLDALKALVAKYPNPFAGLIAVPRTDATFPVIAIAWQHRLRLHSYDQAQLQTFIDLYRGKGPEQLSHSD